MATPLVSMEAWLSYKREFDWFSAHTDEYQRLAGWLLRRVADPLDGLHERRCARPRALLDVGAGPGNLMFVVGDLFGDKVAVEPNPLYCQDLDTGARSRGWDIQVINGFWPDVDLKAANFDLIVCSHVMYYIGRDRWDESMGKMVAALRPGGIAVVVLASSNASPVHQAMAGPKNPPYPICRHDTWGEEFEQYMAEHEWSFTVSELTANAFAHSPVELEMANLFLSGRRIEGTAKAGRSGPMPLHCRGGQPQLHVASFTDKIIMITRPEATSLGSSLGGDV